MMGNKEDSESLKLYKQVIIVRYKYPDASGKLFKPTLGKLIAQACHASLSACSSSALMDLKHWNIQGQTKIVLGVTNEEELLKIYEKAARGKLTVSLIRDAARTVFTEPQYTAVGIGPHLIELIDPITGNLKLL